MALAGAWLDVIGTRRFILLALHAGHNATFVTIGWMRARSAETRRTVRGVRLGNCNCARKRIEMERWKNAQPRLKNFGTKPSGVTKQLCNDEPKLPWRRSKNLSGPIAKQNVWRCMVRGHRVMDTRAGIVAHARGRRPAPRAVPPEGPI
jgi:hypothetical protein